MKSKILKSLIMTTFLPVAFASASQVNLVLNDVNHIDEIALERSLVSNVCEDMRRTSDFEINCLFNQKNIVDRNRYNVTVNVTGKKAVLSFSDKKETISELKNINYTVNLTLNDSEDTKTINSLIARYFKTKKHELALKEFVLASNIASSKRVRLSEDFKYIDNKTNQEISTDQAIRLYTEENPKQKHFWVATMNVGLVLGVGRVWYVIEHDFNLPDVEYKLNWHDFRKRVFYGEGIRLDSNQFETNSLAHPLAGGWYHHGVRSLGYGYLESYLFGFTGSAIWEFFGEYGEKVSINDLILTPGGGSIYGEVLYRLSNHISSRFKNNIIAKTFAFLLNPVGRTNELINGIDRRNQIEKMGLDYDFFSKMDLSVDKDINSNKYKVSFSSKTVDIHEVGTAKEFSTKISAGDITEAKLNGTMGEGAAQDLQVFAKIALAGVYTQYLKEDEKNRINGLTYFAGISTTYEHDKQHVKGFTDKIAVYNVLGPTIEVQYLWKGFRVRMLIDAMASFSQIKSVVIDKLASEGLDLSQGRYSLLMQRYLYAGGFTLNNELEVGYKNFSVQGNLKYYYFNSIDELDRYQERITDKFNITESRTKLNVSAELKLNKYIALKAKYDHTWLYGEAKGETQKLDLGRAWMGVSLGL